mgnify:CR=1 FL=1
MGRVIAIANQKGGVGKTTTAINLSACLAEAGQKVLAIDFDPQGNATTGLGLEKEYMEETVYEMMLGECSLDDCLHEQVQENLDVLPSDSNLAGAEIELLDMEQKEFILRDHLEEVRDNYDFIIIDCPPSLSLLTINALTAADTVLVPIQCEYYALEGLSELISTLKTVRKKYNPYLDIEGVVFTMFSVRYNLTLQVVEQVKKYFGNKVYQTTIPRSIRISEAPSYGQPINFYEPKGKGSEAYMDLAIEFVKSNRPAEAAPKRRRGKAAAEPVETMGLADVKMDG